LEEEAFKDFDQVDDARCAIDENESRPFDDVASFLQNNSMNDSSKDLLRRLLEPNPRHRLKSLLALERIAFFHNYNIDDVRHMKVSKNRASFDCSRETSSIKCQTDN
jgi:serine/threonine protein kinase